MLTEERQAIILDQVNKNRSVKISELCEMLNSSVSTIRRDLCCLADMGKLVKVHGGAIAVDSKFTHIERNVEEKTHLFMEEKTAIAEYAATLVEDGDFIFIDAGTTTQKLIDFLPEKDATYVTNGFIHAKKLAERNFKVYIPGGEIKLLTEAVVGADCVMTLNSYNFSKCFIGTNGISISSGYTTPDVREARVKKSVVGRSAKAYILADHSKFGNITSVTFASLGNADIITDMLPDERYVAYTSVKEVM
ncbi:MAG: DeoR/GlpR family DNA-binding transcription regulator [Lachnospiraceae bacterium]